MGMLESCGVGYVEHFSEISHFNQAALCEVPGEPCRDIFEVMPAECERVRECAGQAGTHSFLHPCCPGGAGKADVCTPGGGTPGPPVFSGSQVWSAISLSQHHHPSAGCTGARKTCTCIAVPPRLSCDTARL